MIYIDVGGKSPNYDAYGLFRALHSHNPPNYSHIVGIVIPLLGSYWGGSQGLSSTYEQAHVDLDLLTLASLYFNYSVFGSLLQDEETQRDDFFLRKC